MKLVKLTNGQILCIGFDMNKREENSRMICWNDPETGDWEVRSDNVAGWYIAPIVLTTEFVKELSFDRIFLYQPGHCLEMHRIGPPHIWAFNFTSGSSIG